MIQYHVYPGGKKRIVTFSYDDGSENDRRLIELFAKYGVKAAFHLNSDRVKDRDPEQLRKLYAGHEVSCHTVHHGWLERMPMQSAVQEIIEDRKALEAIFGVPMVSMSYPSGVYKGDSAAEAARACGMVYGRTICATGNFYLPDNFLLWHPTCHHKDALPLCEQFIKNLDSQWVNPLFYIWGHSHDLKTEEQWADMEKLLQMLSGNDKIWYATGMEIYNYITAQQRLQISADERTFYNPSAIPVWVERNKTEILEIPAGQTVTL